MAVFEDVFSEAQTGMVQAAFDYAAGQADDIYIYFSMLGGSYGADTFFAKDGRVYHTHKLPGVDVSEARQDILLDVYQESLEAIRAACKEFGRPMPMEGYLHYHVGGGLDARYSYEDTPVDENAVYGEELEAWMVAVQAEFDAAR